MSNEYYDWLEDIKCEKAIYNTAKNIYDYIYDIYFGEKQQQIEAREEFGSAGVASTILTHIWNEFIKPYEERQTKKEECLAML